MSRRSSPCPTWRSRAGLISTDSTSRGGIAPTGLSTASDVPGSKLAPRDSSASKGNPNPGLKRAAGAGVVLRLPTRGRAGARSRGSCLASWSRVSKIVRQPPARHGGREAAKTSATASRPRPDAARGDEVLLARRRFGIHSWRRTRRWCCRIEGASQAELRHECFGTDAPVSQLGGRTPVIAQNEPRSPILAKWPLLRRSSHHHGAHNTAANDCFRTEPATRMRPTIGAYPRAPGSRRSPEARPAWRTRDGACA